MALHRRYQADLTWRIWALGIVMLLVLLGFLGRLYWWQIVQRAQWQQSAQIQGIRSERLPAERGTILDRHGAVLVGNRPVFQLWVDPTQLATPEQTLTTLAHVTTTAAEDLLQRWRRRARGDRSLWLAVPDISREVVAWLLARRAPWHDDSSAFDGRSVTLVPKFLRTYDASMVAGHLLGTIREVGKRELAKNREAVDADPRVPRLAPGDLIGVNGVEAAFDARLRGRDGLREYLVDARGGEITVPQVAKALALELPVRGEDLHLTIDASLQTIAEAAFGALRGALVAIVPATGEIVAMVSRPGLQLGTLSGPDSRAYWQSILHDPGKPLLDRTIQGAYPPGSIYKMVVAAAALSEGLVTPTEKIHCSGGLAADGRTFLCHRKSGHGAMDLIGALEQSCDVYFYQMGRRLGADRIAAYAEQFGLGKKTGLGLPHERGGLIPTTAWRLRMRGSERFSLGETFALAIGQGADLLTPLQAAVMVATIANGAVPVHPMLVLRPQPLVPGPPIVATAVLQPIVRGMIAVVEGTHGTAARLKSLKLKIAGKTGTAQVVSLLRGQGISSFNDHAWFVGFAPYDQPAIAVAVLIEHGGHGGAVAAPVAGKVIQEFLKGAPR